MKITFLLEWHNQSTLLHWNGSELFSFKSGKKSHTHKRKYHCNIIACLVLCLCLNVLEWLGEFCLCFFFHPCIAEFLSSTSSLRSSGRTGYRPGTRSTEACSGIFLSFFLSPSPSLSFFHSFSLSFSLSLFLSLSFFFSLSSSLSSSLRMCVCVWGV